MVINRKEKGMTLIDVIIGIALIMLVFYGLYGTFRLSIVLIGSNKAKVGAMSLATEKMEFVRSMSYDALGTVGGIPAGLLPQTETIELNQTTYTRRTFITYVDDPEDGLDDEDENGITADYKKVKVELEWTLKDRVQSYAITSSVVPVGIENITGGGTLKIAVFDASALPVTSAQVRIRNTTVSPPIDVTTFTNLSGVAIFPGGTPEGSNYHITVTKAGYSTDSTYDATAQNPNPLPANLSVVEGETTTGSFAIDVLSNLFVNTFDPVATTTTHDTFDSGGGIAQLSNTARAGGDILLAATNGEYYADGTADSLTIASPYLVSWGEVTFAHTVPETTSLRYQLLYNNGTDFVPIPESDLIGNATGFTTSPVPLYGLATTTYSELRIRALLHTDTTTVTPYVHEWNLSSLVGPVPRGGIPITITSTKTIGTDEDINPIYKYTESQTTNSEGVTSFDAIEWDTYTLTVDGVGGGFDIAQACAALPVTISPASTKTLSLYMTAHTPHSIRVAVVDDAGATMTDASVRVYGGGYDTQKNTGACGQAHFSGVSNSTPYTIVVVRDGYETVTLTGVNISGADSLRVTLPAL